MGLTNRLARNEISKILIVLITADGVHRGKNRIGLKLQSWLKGYWTATTEGINTASLKFLPSVPFQTPLPVSMLYFSMKRSLSTDFTFNLLQQH